MRRGMIVLSALAMSALVACSDPKAAPLPSASPMPTVTPTSGTPSATASEDLRASLRSSLTAYFDALYAAGLDPANKTDELAALIAPSCPCYRVVEVLREEAREGHYIDYRYTLRDVAVTDVGDAQGDVRYTVNRSAGAERDGSGRVIERYVAVTEKYSARFVRGDGRWLLNRLTRFA